MRRQPRGAAGRDRRARRAAVGILFEDVRRGARVLGREQRVASLIALLLALGVGALAAIVGVADRVLFRPLPVADPDAVVALYAVNRRTSAYQSTSFPDYEDLRAATHTLVDLAAYVRLPVRARIGDRSESLGGEAVTWNFFATLGIRPAAGRFFGPEDEARLEGRPVAVISERLWRRAFDASPSVIGRALALNGRDVRVLGVVPASFTGQNLGWAGRQDVWFPLSAADAIVPALGEADVLHQRTIPLVLMIGRLAPGVGLEPARAEMEVLASRLTQPGSDADVALELYSAGRAKFWPANRPVVERSLLAFAAAGGLILVLIASNVANLLLARAVRRRRETALRLALGAGRSRLLLQILIESLWFAVPGFVAAVGVAWLVQRVLLRFPSVFGVGLSMSPQLDGRLIAICAVTALATAALYALVPALRLRSVDLASAWRHDPRTTTSGRTTSVRSALLVLQVGLSLVLLAGSVLVGRALMEARSIDPGFDLSRLVVMTVEEGSAPDGRVPPARAQALARDVARMPAVASVALASETPLAGTRSVATVRSTPAGSAVLTADRHVVSDAFFDALGIDVIRGRTFDDRDAGGDAGVVVNQLLATRLWPDSDPIGQTIALRSGQVPERTLRVIGVVANVRYSGLFEDPRPYVYERDTPASSSARSPIVLIRASDDPARVVQSLRSMPLPAGLTIGSLSTGAGHLARALGPQRAANLLVGVFALLALLIAGVGLAGTVSFTFQQRRREIAIRMAVGGTPLRVTRQVLRHVVWIVSGGLLAGSLASAAFMRLLAARTPVVAPHDWANVGAAAGVLVLCCAIAALVPAWRATRVDPARVLRS